MKIYKNFEDLRAETELTDGQELFVDRKVKQFRYLFVADSVKEPLGIKIICPDKIAEDQPGRLELQHP